jgi:hypothetical protein
MTRRARAAVRSSITAVDFGGSISVLDLVAFESGLAVRHPLRGWRTGELTCSPLFATTPGELASSVLSMTSSENKRAARQFATSTGEHAQENTRGERKNRVRLAIH